MSCPDDFFHLPTVRLSWVDVDCASQVYWLQCHAAAVENKSYAHISDQLSGRDRCLREGKKSFQIMQKPAACCLKTPTEFPRKLLGFIAVFLKTVAKSDVPYRQS